MSAVLGCPGFLEDSTTTIEWRTLTGQPTLALVTIGTSRGSDEIFTFTTILYLDPETYLPVHGTTDGVHSYGPVKTETTHVHEFVARDTLPADFFDPASLATEGLNDVAPDTTIYWLGKRFDPEDDLPPLVVGNIDPSHHEAPGFDVSISYAIDGEPGTDWAVAMMEWSRPVWDETVGAAVREHWGGTSCHQQIEIELGNAQATIYMGYGDTIVPSDSFFYYLEAPENSTTPTPCTGEPFTRFEAVVVFEDTAVLVHAQPGSVYRSVEGLEAIVRGLQPHRPE